MGPLGKCAEAHGTTQSLVDNEVEIQVALSPKKLEWVLRGGRRVPKMFARQCTNVRFVWSWRRMAVSGTCVAEGLSYPNLMVTHRTTYSSISTQIGHLRKSRAHPPPHRMDSYRSVPPGNFGVVCVCWLFIF